MPTETALKKVGTFTAACVLVSNAVGSGIFTTTGFMARDLGDPRVILLLWVIGGALGPTPPTLALVWMLTGVHDFGVERGGAFQRLITVVKIGGIGLLVGGGFAFGPGGWSHLATRSAV